MSFTHCHVPCCCSPSQRCLWNFWRWSRLLLCLHQSFRFMTSSLWAPHLREEPAAALPAWPQVNGPLKRKTLASYFLSRIQLYLNLSLFLLRGSSFPEASRWFQSVPGPSLCSGASAGWFRLWGPRRPPADEAHLWHPAHLHSCAGLSWGQRWSRAQRLVKAVIGPVRSATQMS